MSSLKPAFSVSRPVCYTSFTQFAVSFATQLCPNHLPHCNESTTQHQHVNLSSMGFENMNNTMNLQSTSNSNSQMEFPRPAKIVCIGDIHSQWDESDESALRGLNPDLALFVGDYGNEDVEVTSRISKFASTVNFGIATVFGNHDAHFTASSRKRIHAPYDTQTTCRVSEQMQMLAPYDVSYRAVPFDDLQLCVCGGRPFSFGGPNWKYGSFFRQFIGVEGMTESSNKIANAAISSSFPTLIFLCHSGPIGLGDQPIDPCGKDWGSNPGGDYGDKDLRYAIEEARKNGFKVPLTVFGHMHKTLQQDRGQRIMLKTEWDGNDKIHTTIMLNAAIVPRHIRASKTYPALHNFQIVQLDHFGNVDTVEEAWVAADGTIHKQYNLFDASNPSTFTHAISTSTSSSGTLYTRPTSMSSSSSRARSPSTSVTSPTIL